MNFSDRFTLLYSGLNIATIDILSEQEFNANYLILNEMILSVKRHSVLLSKKSRSEIYYALTEHADPKIGLILASARDKSGNQIFATTDIVKQFMFAQETDEAQSSDVTFRDKTVFVDGIKRVSTALAAALLIGQLAQVPEQQQHSEYLEKQAIADLDRILQVPELQDLIKADTLAKSDDEKVIKSFYFKPGVYELANPLLMQVFISGSNNWILVGSYSNKVNTATLIAELADTINSYTLTSQISNLVAAPVLAGDNSIHRLDFSSRSRDLILSSELVSVRFISNDNSVKVPFIWGIDLYNLTNYYLNSLILITQIGKVTSLAGSSDDDKLKLNVLYFQQRTDITPTTDDIEYRISPTMDETRFITIESTAQDRAAGATLALLNDLFEEKANNNVLGSIIQNDPETNTLVYSGIHLVSFIINNSITEYILDIVSLPEDIELALGNKLGPITSFSNKPRSVTVIAYYERQLADSINLLDNFIGKSLLVKSKPASIVQKMNDIREAQYISYKPKQGYPMPPATVDAYNYDPKNYL